jgi:hypothetical protein
MKIYVWNQSYTQKPVSLNISEDLYLIGVALVFLILSFTLGLEIWVIHNSFFEDTIWIDIFSSSIFLVLTDATT